MKGVLLILLFCFAPAMAQNDVERLHKNFGTAKNDDQKIEALLRLSQHYYDKAYIDAYPYATDSSYYFLHKAQRLCLQSNNQIRKR